MRPLRPCWVLISWPEPLPCPWQCSSYLGLSIQVQITLPSLAIIGEIFQDSSDQTIKLLLEGISELSFRVTNNTPEMSTALKNGKKHRL